MVVICGPLPCSALIAWVGLQPLVFAPQLVLGGFALPSAFATITAPRVCRFLQLKQCHCYGDSGIGLGAHRGWSRDSTPLETIQISVAAVLGVGAAG